MVDRLAQELGQSVLIENAQQKPVWWSTVGPVDRTRLRTVLHRSVDPEAAEVVGRFDLAAAREPRHLPAIPEAGMWARWCVPVRQGENRLGLLWILDPDGAIDSARLGPAVACAQEAASALLDLQQTEAEQTRTRDALLAQLLERGDPTIAEDLIRHEGLPADAVVTVQCPGEGGWPLPGGSSAHVSAPESARPATSGDPLPLADLAEAVRRAVATRRVVDAGARLPADRWSALGAWLLVVHAPEWISPADLHPGAAVLLDPAHERLAETARAVLELGGDVAAAAEAQGLHRTTLYYRLGRITELTGVDLRTDADRSALQFALRLAAYRATPDPGTS